MNVCGTFERLLRREETEAGESQVTPSVHPGVRKEQSDVRGEKATRQVL